MTHTLQVPVIWLAYPILDNRGKSSLSTLMLANPPKMVSMMCLPHAEAKTKALEFGLYDSNQLWQHPRNQAEVSGNTSPPIPIIRRTKLGQRARRQGPSTHDTRVLV